MAFVLGTQTGSRGGHLLRSTVSISAAPGGLKKIPDRVWNDGASLGRLLKSNNGVLPSTSNPLRKMRTAFCFSQKRYDLAVMVMDPIEIFPDSAVTDCGPVSRAFLSRGWTTFGEACRQVHLMPYGYNASRAPLVLFQENKGTCTTKHMAVGLLAGELGLAIHKFIGIYAMTEALVTGAGAIATAYSLPYIPVVHCFLSDGTSRVDLTEGNLNGKNGPIDTFLFTAQVSADISEKEEYHLYRSALQDRILARPEMSGIALKSVLQAREASLALLKTNMHRQQAAAE